MSTSPFHLARTNVLFVDSDTAFLVELQSAMECLSDGTWNVIVAADSATALTALSSQRIDLAVLEGGMQLVNGVHLLQIVHRKHPQLKKAVLNDQVDDVARAAALVGGAEVALVKPHDTVGFANLFKALNELLQLHAEQSFRATHRGIDDIPINKIAAAAPLPPAVAGPTVDEVVVCSQDGDVLYAVQSTDAHERGSLCRELLESAGRLQSLLPLGAFERIEFVSSAGRMLMRAQEGHAIFLRASDA